MKTKEEKVKIFKELFSGLENTYGTYNPSTGRAYQEKSPVTNNVIIDHLTGRKPYGVYLLVNCRIRAIVVDFDTKDQLPPMEFLSSAKHYGITAYIERSKSKGHHVWMFFNAQGVLAAKARLVVRHILDEIEQPDTEVFPKQDEIAGNVQYGNFINAPLFGALVPNGKTVFVHPLTFKQYRDQWSFLESIKKISESVLDDIIEMNDLSGEPRDHSKRSIFEIKESNSYCLPICAQRMLYNGVRQYQRVSCFRLAVHLKRLGLPSDLAVAALKVWAQKNQPGNGNRIITECEIIDQTSYAFSKSYRGYGCNSVAVAPFCEKDCPVNKLRMQN
jgi:hypothetical protein